MAWYDAAERGVKPEPHIHTPANDPCRIGTADWWRRMLLKEPDWWCRVYTEPFEKTKNEEKQK